MSEVVSRLRLLDELRRLAKKGASIEASVITTFALNGLFYEEVLLRALERAGSRLNILLVDARQLAIAFQDPTTRPRRAGRDYLLIPVDAASAFHPKIAVLFSPKKPLVAVGSHNVTDSGYARNDEVTVCWGHQSSGVPRKILEATLAFVLDWARTSPGIEDLVDEVARRLMRVAEETAIAPAGSAAFIGWRPGELSLLQQLKQHVPGPAGKISVVAPYFDDNLKLLHELAIRWAPREMVVGIQQQSAMLVRPERVPSGTRFVEFSASSAVEKSDGQRQPPFLHGKLVALETDGGIFVVVGSPNASAAAWLQGEFSEGNAEAAIVLDGELASTAFQTLGLNQLTNAPPLSATALAAVAENARKMRRLSEQDSPPAIPMLSAVATEFGWLLPGLDARDCRSAVLMERHEVALPEATFRPYDGGVQFSMGNQKTSSGSLRIDGEFGPLAFAILNDAPRLRTLLRPREAGRLLEALGRIDDYEGFDELFDLFERHVLRDDSVSQQRRSQSAGQTSYGSTTDEEQNTPGPRGISLASLVPPLNGRPQLDKDDFVADFLKALIRDLASPSLPIQEGDPPDIDEEELDPGKRRFSISAAPLSLPPGEWERLVTACRKRIGVFIGRLSKRLDLLPTGPDAAASQAGKVLTTMRLLQKLRLMEPPEGSQPTFRCPESLVAVFQLRSVFKVAMRALYRRGGLAGALEVSTRSRGSEDRRLLDAVILWAAREIGVDFDADATFNEDPNSALLHDHDRIDGLVAAVSAAAHAGTLNSISKLPVRPWADAPRLRAGWMDRHIALGTAFQAQLTCGELPLLRRPVATRDIVVWRKEPLFPRLVAELGSKRASLLEPGDQSGSEPLKVHPDFLLALDFSKLRAEALVH